MSDRTRHHRTPGAAAWRRAAERAPWAWPAVLAALLAGGWLLFAPPTPDLAAQVYRTGLFREHGFTLFNAQWYAGHHTPGYSLLFPPLAALLGPRVVGALAAVASAALFAAVAGRHFGHRARWGIGWFAAATATDLFIGRLTFGLGVTIALATVLALQRGRPRTAVALAVLTTCASPVAGLFLAMGAFADWLARRRGATLAAAAGALVPALALALAFPEGGHQPWGLTSFVIVLAIATGVVLLLPRDEPTLRAGAAVYAVAVVAAFALATPMGSNATRLAALVAGPLLVCALAGRAPRRVLVAVAVPLLAWQWWGPIRETAKGVVDPSSRLAFYTPLLEQIEGRADAAARVEIPFTRMHWESVHVARRFPLARGWETQLDVKYNPLFRQGRRLTSERYQHWLHANAVRYVALPAVPLDPAARQEARLIRRGLPYLEKVWGDRHWSLYEVAGARGLAGRDAQVRRLGPTSFTLDASRAGTTLVRVRWTPYWRVTRGRACVRRGPDGWTVVDAARAGTIRVATRFDPRRIFTRGPACGRR